MPHRILLADDSLTIQKVIELTFSGTDFELKAVGNGDLALPLLDSFSPDIVLADCVMPGKTGYEVCEEVKRRPGGRFVPVVLLTGTFEPFDKPRAEQAGADSVVTKPFDSQGLASLVRDLVNKAAEERAAAPPEPPPAPEPPPFPNRLLLPSRLLFRSSCRPLPSRNSLSPPTPRSRAGAVLDGSDGRDADAPASLRGGRLRHVGDPGFSGERGRASRPIPRPRPRRLPIRLRNRSRCRNPRRPPTRWISALSMTSRRIATSRRTSPPSKRPGAAPPGRTSGTRPLRKPRSRLRSPSPLRASSRPSPPKRA